MGSIGVMVCLSAALTACGDGGATGGGTAVATVTPSGGTESKTAPPTPGGSVQAVLDAMSLEEKAGQLIMVPVMAGGGVSQAASAVSDSHVGSVLFLGEGWDSASGVKAAVADLTAATSGTAGLYVAADQEGGRVQRLRGDGFDSIPTGVEQGQMSAGDLETHAEKWGGQLAAAGVNLDLAPVVDTVEAADRRSNAPIGALDRDFGLDAAGNAAHATAFVTGMTQAGVGTVVKHFPGLGHVKGNTDVASSGVTDTVTGGDSPAVQAFADAIKAEPAMVMVSLATYSRIDADAPAALSHAVVTELLRDQLGWKGVVVSDSLTAEAVQGVRAEDRAVRFVEAGGDLACFGSVDEALTSLRGLVDRAKSDQEFAAAVDAAAARVLTAKAAAGLL
jgi:beta-N-acetylhexosaminidase